MDLTALCRTVVAAFSMFSAIPVPHIDWSKTNLRYVLCALPLVGAVIGAAMALWLAVAGLLSISAVPTGAVLALLPLLLSGGVHMDGYLDVADALMSRGDAEKKRAVLKDPRCGAGAVMAGGAYLLLSAAFFTEAAAHPGAFPALCLSPVLSRVAAALCTVWPAESAESAKGNGLLHTFREAADTRGVLWTLLGWALAAAALSAVFSPAYLPALLLGPAGALLLARRTAEKHFGGMSGDLAGYAVQLSELCTLVLAVLTERLVALV